jgi:hypothetical protein
MINTLARQTAIVLLEKLPDDYIEPDDNLWGEFVGDRQPPQRIKTAELWRCFYANKTLKIVQAPSDPTCTYPYTIVYQGWLLRESETYSLERAIAYVDLCIKNIPEFSQPDLIPASLSRGKKEKIEYEILKILAFLDKEYPEPIENDDDLFDLDLANMLVEIASIPRITTRLRRRVSP